MYLASTYLAEQRIVLPRRHPHPHPPPPRAAPVDPQAAGGLNSYVPTTSFANGWGQLAVVRCLGSSNPGTLCVYSGYDMPAQVSAARARRRPAVSAALAAAAAAVVGWLLL